MKTFAHWVLLLAISSPAMAGPGHDYNRPLPMPRPLGTVCFYQDNGYRGASFCKHPGDAIENLANFSTDRMPTWNDKISGIQIIGDAMADVWTDAYFRGQFLTVTESTPLLAGWNDKISSLYVRTAREPRPGPRPDPRPDPRLGRVCFYKDFSYNGASFCLRPGETIDNLANYVSRDGIPGWNDKISSIYVGGRIYVDVYSDAHFRGATLQIFDSTPTLPGWNDKISSIRVR